LRYLEKHKDRTIADAVRLFTRRGSACFVGAAARRTMARNTSAISLLSTRALAVVSKTRSPSWRHAPAAYDKCFSDFLGTTLPVHTLLNISQLAWHMMLEVDVTAMVPAR
jgi:hypothetical protein